MYLVSNSFRREILEAAKGSQLSQLDAHWWAGYALGLSITDSLTQKEHDEIVNLISASEKEATNEKT